jgi:serine/threonine-protein kinase
MPNRGTAIGRFAVATEVSSRKHATVLQARDSDGLFVALKLARTKVGAALLDHEARALESLEADPGPAPCLCGAGIAAGRPFIATGWMRGAGVRVVAAEIREQGVPGEMLGLCCRVVQSYAELHDRGALHGHIHPRHVLVDGGGSVRLLDFSLAASRAGAQPVVRFHSLSAPEQAEALLDGEDPPLTAAAEQYSVSALLYLLITGRMYARMELDRHTLARDIVARSPLSFVDQGVTAWPELEEVLGRGLEKQPDRRYASVGDLAQALQALASAGDRSAARPVPAVEPALTGVLEQFLRDAADEDMISNLPAPTCSVNLGSAGVAFALMRIGKLRGDASVLALADRWLRAAETRQGDPDAFDDGDELTPATVGVVSPFHSASGLAAARVFLSDATGDRAGQQAALDDFRAATDAPCANLDLTLGRSSVLLVSALLYARAEPDWPAARRLADHADRLHDGIWRDLAGMTMPYYGLAHGWGGVAYASLMWARARGAEPPRGARDVLTTLADVAEPHERGARWPLTGPDGGLSEEFWPGWCHGNAGYVFLWNLAHATYGEDRFAQLAEQAAWLAGEDAGVVHLCCGAAGQAYAALNHYRSTGDVRWRSRAVRTADSAARAGQRAADSEPPLSLYRGSVGLALLAVELQCPEYAAMPLFEFEPGVQT